MGKIVVIGLVGKSDFLKIDHFADVGETVMAKDYHIEYGGKGFNQALALNTLGADITYITRMGNDEIYKSVKKLCKEEHLKNKIFTSPNGRSAEASILTDINGNNEVYCYAGNNVDLTIEDIKSCEKLIKDANYLVLQLELTDESLFEAIKIATQNKVKVVLNPAPYHKLNDEVLKSCYLLTPNEVEAKALFNLDEITTSNVLNLPYDKLVITLGEKGAMVKENDHIEIIPSEPVKAVDTTGAGDTFNGALVYYLDQGDNLFDAVKKANHAAGISVSYPYVFEGIKRIK